MTTTPTSDLSTQELLQYETQKKSMGLAYLLWFLLGSLGIHHFYMGKKRRAIFYLVSTIGGSIVLTIGIVAGFMTGSILGIVMGIIGGVFVTIVSIRLLIDLFTLHKAVTAHNMALLENLKGAPENKSEATATPPAETT